MAIVRSQKIHPESRLQRSRNGFAVIIALSLMAFIVLLLLTVVTLVQVETKASANAMQRLQARQNALLGLQVALGQLQGEVGPDQRVTGRADLLDTDASTVAADGVDAPFWTGAWKSYNPATGANNELDVGSSPTLRAWSTAIANEGPRWLVSNPDPSAPLDPKAWTGQTTGADPDAVVIARQIGALGAGGTATDVSVPLVPINAPTDASQDAGHFAYWVEDEGIKAKVNSVPNVASELASGSSAEDQALNARHYLAPATLAAEQALAPDYRSDLLAEQANLGKLASTRSLGVILGSDFQTKPDGYAQSHPDITTWSRGVLADVRRGGLKTDLTAAFEDLDQFTRLISRSPPGRDETNGGPDDEIGAKLWRVPGVDTSVAAYLDGPRWHSLYYYYNLHKKTFTDFGTGKTPLGGIWYTEVPEGLGGIGGNAADMGFPVFSVSGNNRSLAVGRLIPTMVGMRLPIFFSTYLGDIIDGSQTVGVNMHYSPQLVYYNPWSIDLNNAPDPTSAPLISRSIFDFKFLANSKIRITNETSGDVIYDGPIAPANPALGPANDSFSLAAGQLKVFGSKYDSTTGDYKTYDLPNEYPLVEDFNKNTFNTYQIKVDKSGNELEIPEDAIIKVELLVNLETVSGVVNVNDSKWGFDWQPRQGGIYLNPLVTNATYPVVSGARADSYLRAGNSTPQAVGVFVMRLKGRDSSNIPNVPAMGGAGALWNPLFTEKNSYFWEVEVFSASANLADTEFTEVTDMRNGRSESSTTWGEEDLGQSANPNQTSLVLKEIFNQPLVSIGQFKNADTVFYESLYPVGNSWADPELANPVSGNQTRLWVVDVVDASLTAVDDNFLNNEALFDQFFFSTIPPVVLPIDTIFPPEWNTFGQAAVDTDERLLNPRLRYYRTKGQSPDVADLRDMDKAAAHLLVDGAFNVNSTSIPAWRALLGSLRYATNPTNAFPVPRLITDLTTEPTSDDYATGMRVLDDTQLDRLAEEIVEQVKLRGPFLSMADFVNRRRESGNLGQAGALQAAIDASGINQSALTELGKATDLSDPKGGIITLPAIQPDTNRNYPRFVDGITPAVSDNTAAGAPGVITQADLLQPLAPLLVARSDTFRIRFYGESLDKVDGKLRSFAVGEAIVQRVPEFIDPTDTALSVPQDPSAPSSNLGNATPVTVVDASNRVIPNPDLNAINSDFGRRFEIVSIRWLNPDEI